MYWDLKGDYAAFDTLSGKALTKLDHRPFLDEDYRKLNAILSDPYSSLAFYSQKELTGDQRVSQVDGLTGATIDEVKSQVTDQQAFCQQTQVNNEHRFTVVESRLGIKEE